MRYTDRDCYAALVRVAAALNKRGADFGVSLPLRSRCKYAGKLEDLAEQLDVPVRRWGDKTIGDGRRLILDHAPSDYGGGVRPAYCEAHSSGEFTPRWWSPSAGNGPGAVPRKEFCYILSAVEHALLHEVRS